MHSDLELILNGLGGRAACVAISMGQEEPRSLLSLHADEVFPAASLAKVPILAELARQLAQPESTLTWETRPNVLDTARVPSDGVLADLSPDLRPTLHDLAHLMITISDNTASNVLLDLVGMDAVNATMRDLGLQATRLERRFIDFEARKAGRDNWTTAADMTLLFSLIASGRVPEHERLLTILLHQNDYSILPAYWGEDGLFAHKTGGLEGVMHDAGILFRAREDRREPLIVAALTAEQADIPLTRLTLARVGRALRQVWLDEH
ncbi:MAG TPA: serine hydrolase [Ktedonobacteraceae bacterium]|jgi:beta-lactamase class A|nr:serine hydrolase [Ktedonobacteraceae bacterium]